MFQSTMLKRAARLAAPAAAAAATTVGVVSMTSSSGDDRQQQVRGVALCEDKKDASVLSMLGDIQARVSFVMMMSCLGRRNGYFRNVGV